jgi:hypothetical protein
MRHFLALTIASLFLLSCSKKPTACIDVLEENFNVKRVQLNSCAADAEYQIWTFEDETGIEGEKGSKWFHKEGYHSAKLTCYNKSGKKNDEISSTFFSGYKYLDSLIITGLSDDLFLNQQSNSFANLYVIYDHDTSNEVYSNATSADLPLIFTFKNEARIDQNETYIRLMDQRSQNEILKSYEELMVHEDYTMPWEYKEGTPATTNYFLSNTYWHFNK